MVHLVALLTNFRSSLVRWNYSVNCLLSSRLCDPATLLRAIVGFLHFDDAFFWLIIEYGQADNVVIILTIAITIL